MFGNPNIGNSDTTEYTVKSLVGGKNIILKSGPVMGACRVVLAMNLW